MISSVEFSETSCLKKEILIDSINLQGHIEEKKIFSMFSEDENFQEIFPPLSLQKEDQNFSL